VKATAHACMRSRAREMISNGTRHSYRLCASARVRVRESGTHLECGPRNPLLATVSIPLTWILGTGRAFRQRTAARVVALNFVLTPLHPEIQQQSP